MILEDVSVRQRRLFTPASGVLTRVVTTLAWPKSHATAFRRRPTAANFPPNVS
jgi:hypothetical protein